MEDYKIIIELNGPPHFVQVSNWQNPETTREIDLYKMTQAKKNGYSVIRLLQNDVLNDKIQWHAKLKQHINEQDTPCVIYICENNEYDNFEQNNTHIEKPIKTLTSHVVETNNEILPTN